ENQSACRSNDPQASCNTPCALMADNATCCARILNYTNPAARIVVWSDMFDPNHNAVDHFYLVNGSWEGSWKGLPPDVIIANWNSGKAAQALKWFAGRGHPQILAGYYDDGLDNFKHWHKEAQGIPQIKGFLYTTWQ